MIAPAAAAFSFVDIVARGGVGLLLSERNVNKQVGSGHHATPGYGAYCIYPTLEALVPCGIMA